VIAAGESQSAFRLVTYIRAYVARFDEATRNAVRAGFLLKPDAKLLKRWARGSDVGR